MTTYHIKASGDIGICRAHKGNCPLSTEGAVHVENASQAHQIAEEIIKKQNNNKTFSGLTKQ